jgi:vacuolar-type H+-ATPase subunit H
VKPAATSAPAAPDAQSFAALKRVKSTELEWAAKLAAARAESEATLARLRDESAAAIKAAIAEAEKERAAAIQTARTEAGGLAATIVAQGAKAADQALRVEGKKPEERKDEVLAVTLGSFGAD